MPAPHDTPGSPLDARLQRLRSLRVRPNRNAALSADLAAAARDLERRRTRLSGVSEAWERVCPAPLADMVAIVGVSRGVLTLGVPDASTRYELDRWLREGGENALIRQSPSSVRRVRVTLDPR